MISEKIKGNMVGGMAMAMRPFRMEIPIRESTNPTSVKDVGSTDGMMDVSTMGFSLTTDGMVAVRFLGRMVLGTKANLHLVKDRDKVKITIID